ncbi:hypothetical protein ACIQM3_14520 [Streptomyces sp. NPDC091271]|uniref:hypothetical protein n=1 Tax=Streptomyces sp. NPDC091271 TaxID=3365980 RepID=UPI0037FC3B5A
MRLQESPLWWLFAAISAGIWYAVMLPAMPTRTHKIFVSVGPPATFAVIALYCGAYDEKLVAMLPVYCGLVLSVPAGILGHRRALREVLADPAVPYGEASGPWTLQAGVALAAFLGLAVHYTAH